MAVTIMLQLSLIFVVGISAETLPHSLPSTGLTNGIGGVFGQGLKFGSLPGVEEFINRSAKWAASPNCQAPSGPAQPEPKSQQPKGDLNLGSFVGLLGNILQGKQDLTSLIPYMDCGPDFQDISLSAEQASHSGTGKYPAGYVTDPTLPGKTIFAPKSPPPPNVQLPVIVWGEGGCFRTGSLYAPFLTEIASHGYIILANGPPGIQLPRQVSDLLQLVGSGQTKVTDMLESIDWVMAGKGSKYGNIDTSKIVAAGQSCGGSEALSASYRNDKVKLTILVNSGAMNALGKNLLQELKAPVGIFNGGPRDIAYQNGQLTYSSLPAGHPAFQANLDTGHIGTLFAKNGGKFGKAIVSFLEWQLRGDAKAKAICLDPNSSGSLVSEHWNVTHKNWT